MKYIVIDFETFYDSASGLTLRKLSTPEYIGHKRFKVHCLGVEYDGVRKILWGDKAIQDWLDGWRDYDGEYCFVMHNAFFDAAILKWRYDFVPARMICTLLIANHVLGSAKDSGKGNSLASLAERLGLPSKGRLDFMDGVETPDAGQRAMLSIYLAGADDEPGTGDLGLTRRVLDKLLPFVSNPDVELWLIDHTLKIYAEKALTLNYDTVKRAEGLIEVRRSRAIDRLLRVGDYVERLGAEKTREAAQVRLSSNKQFERDLIDMLSTYNVATPRKVRALTKAELKKFEKLKLASLDGKGEMLKLEEYLTKLQSEGVEIWETDGDITIGETKTVPALAKKDEDFIRLSFSSYEGISALVNARLIERSAITSTARLDKMRRVAGGLGVMPVHLVYYGAHTGRWAGGGGFNFQNLTNPDREADIGKKEIAAAIRESFEAPPGYVFVSADAAQIEARVSAWIAGQWDLLEKFRKGVDIYSSFISDVLNEDIHKPKGTESEAEQSHLKLMRHIGKEAVLGLGYTMGWRKFVSRLREDPNVAKMFEIGKLSNEFCQGVVEKYRDMHPDIVACWKDLNNAFFVAKDKGIREVGPIRFTSGKPVGSTLPVVNAILPSGRVMYYRDIRQESTDDNGYNGGKEWKHGGGQRLYGGLILENVTQAISRDILAESLIRSELDRKFPIVLHVHDSIVGLCKEDEAEDNLKWLIESLKTNPEWAGKQLVLNAEGKIGRTLVT